MGTAVSYVRQETLDVTALQRDLELGKVGHRVGFKICDHHIKKHSSARAAYLKARLHSGFVCGKVSYEKALKLLEYSAEKSYPPAIRDLAAMFFLGKREWLKSREPLYINDNEQLGLFQTRIKNMIADCPNISEGRDYKKSFRLLNDGVRLDTNDGLMALYFGQHYEFGYSTEIDYKMALDRYEEAFRLGEKTALDYICGMYIGQKGCDLRSEEALRFLTMNETMNRNFSKINMALLYEARGEFEKAHKYCLEYLELTRDNRFQRMLANLAEKKDHSAIMKTLSRKEEEKKPEVHPEIDPEDHVAEPQKPAHLTIDP